MFTSSPSKTVMYPAAANLGMLRREFLSMVGTMCTSFAGWRTLWCSCWISLAGVCVPSGSWNTLVDGLPVGMKACLELSFVVAVGNGRWDGAVEDSTSDGLRAIGDVAHDVHSFAWWRMILLFDLAGWRGCVG